MKPFFPQKISGKNPKLADFEPNWPKQRRGVSGLCRRATHYVKIRRRGGLFVLLKALIID